MAFFVPNCQHGRVADRLVQIIRWVAAAQHRLSACRLPYLAVVRAGSPAVVGSLDHPQPPYRQRHLKRARRSVDAFDDAEVALEAVGEGHQRLLVCLALVCRDGLFKAVELDQNDALRDSGLVGDDSTATGQGAAAPSLDSRTGQLEVGSQPLRVGNGGVDTDPVALSHGNLLCSAGHVRLRIDTQTDSPATRSGQLSGSAW